MGQVGVVKKIILLLVSLAACRRAESDEARIRRIFFEAAKAAEERQIGEVVKDVSDRFHSGDVDRDSVKSIVAAAVLRGGWVSATVTGASVRVLGDEAQAVVDLVLARGKGRPSLASLAPDEASVERFEFALSREREGWKIVSASHRSVNLADALEGPTDPKSPSPP